MKERENKTLMKVGALILGASLITNFVLGKKLKEEKELSEKQDEALATIESFLDQNN